MQPSSEPSLLGQSQIAIERTRRSLEAIEPSDKTDDVDDSDSTYGSLDGCMFTSLASSIIDYKYENGRRYHAYHAGQYVLPNDELEQERLDLQHYIWRLILGGNLFTAPISDPLRILDLGTGTGNWAIDMADQFPGAEVEGLDLSPIQPEWVPPNCTFQVDDFDEDWEYAPGQAFDYIHGRGLSGSSSDWSKFYAQVYANLRPGGWVEMQENDLMVFSDHVVLDRNSRLIQCTFELDEASTRTGKQMNVAQYQKQWMINAGFVNVREQVHRIPIGTWAKDPRLKELGHLECAQVQMSAESHIPALFTRVLSYTTEQVHDLIGEMKIELRRKDLHLWKKYRFITGQRPAISGNV